MRPPKYGLGSLWNIGDQLSKSVCVENLRRVFVEHHRDVSWVAVVVWGTFEEGNMSHLGQI